MIQQKFAYDLPHRVKAQVAADGLADGPDRGVESALYCLCILSSLVSQASSSSVQLST